MQNPSEKLKSRLLVAAGAVLIGAGMGRGESAPVSREVRIDADRVENKFGKDDLAALKKIATGVGADFSPNEECFEVLRQMGTQWLRMICVDLLPARFDADGTCTIDPNLGTDGMTHYERAIGGLEMCRKVGANPHYVIGICEPPALRVDGGGLVSGGQNTLGLHPRVRYWNGDWTKMRSYWKAIFRMVMIEHGFPQARFEVGNEPDTLGQFLATTDFTIDYKQGSKKAYEVYLELYRNAYQAAREFEKENPGMKVRLGGPALAWPYTFFAGELNWADQFIKDTANEKMIPDFIGIHFYGNSAGLKEPRSKGDTMRTFQSMFRQTAKSRDRYLPGVPIILTEWGPSYHNHNADVAYANANEIGAAWNAEFVKVMAEEGVDAALYLTITDYADPETADANRNVWGYIAYFVNPTQFDGKAWPKAPLHPLRMYTWLHGNRVKVEGLGGGINGIAASSAKDASVQFLVWNFQVRIGENDRPVVLDRPRNLVVKVVNARAVLGSARTARVRIWRVSENESNAFTLWNKERKIDERAELTPVWEGDVDVTALGGKGVELPMPNPSVAFVSIEAKAPPQQAGR